MKKYEKEFKNLFITIPDLKKIFYIIKHYIDKLNKSKTGCYFIYNLDMLLYNITNFKNTLKKSTKKAEDVLYYPFYNKSFPTLILNDFVDCKNNALIQDNINQMKPFNLINKINESINKLNNEKLSKDQIVDIFDKFERSLWVINKCYKDCIKEYEKSHNK